MDGWIDGLLLTCYVDVASNTNISGTFQDLALPLSPSHAETGTPPANFLIVLSVNPNPEAGSTTTGSIVPPHVQQLQTSLLSFLGAKQAALKLHTSLYRDAGAATQPEAHPMVDAAAAGEWLVTVVVVDEAGVVGREDVAGLVEAWVDGVQEGKGDGDVELSWGVWSGDVLMSRPQGDGGSEP